MSVPRTAADVLADHVVLEVECIDRMYLNLYQPRLMFLDGVLGFFRSHRGQPIASSALMDPMTKAFVADVKAFAADEGLEIVSFEKGQRKDDVAAAAREGFEGEGIYLIGRAQEKTRVVRTEKRRNPETGATYPWLVYGTAIVNHYYFYGVDAEFGPFFVKFCTYFPYTAKLCINGNERAKTLAAAQGLDFEPLDNAFASCSDPAALQEICSSLDGPAIDALARRWLARLPHPFTQGDREAGYRYEISVLQAEFSLTQMLDRPLSGRVLFEDLIRENLDLGRPEQVSLIFNRRVHQGRRNRTQARFRTRVITNGVIPSIHVDYKSSRIKQYHKEGRALRTETTINNPNDFGARKGLEHLGTLAEIGFGANRRLLATQRASRDTIEADTVIDTLTTPQTVNGQRVAALRLGDRRVLALMAAICKFMFCPDGFSNRDLRPLVAHQLGTTTESMTAGKMTYDLRRLRLHGLIARVPHTHRYRLTNAGLRAALVYTRAQNRLIRPTCAELTTNAPSPISRAYTHLLREIDKHAETALLRHAA